MIFNQTALYRMRHIAYELRKVRDTLLFSQRRIIAKAITAVDDVTGDLPPVRTHIDLSKRCRCGRAELVLGWKEPWLKYEQLGGDVLGWKCPYCGSTLQEVLDTSGLANTGA